MPSSTPNTPDKGGKPIRNPHSSDDPQRSRPRPGRNFSGPRVSRSASGDGIPGSRSSQRREGIHRARSGRMGGAPVRRGSNDGSGQGMSSRRGNLSRSKSANVSALDASFGDFGDDMNASARASSRFARIGTATASQTMQTTLAMEQQQQQQLSPPTAASMAMRRARSPTRSKSSKTLLGNSSGSPTRSRGSRGLPASSRESSPNRGLNRGSNHSLTSLNDRGADNDGDKNEGSNASLTSLGGSSSHHADQQQRSMAQLQNSTFALRRDFLNDSSSQFGGVEGTRRFAASSSLLGPSGGGANSGTSTPTDAFSMSLLKFPTVTSSAAAAAAANSIFDDDDDDNNYNNRVASSRSQYQSHFGRNTSKQPATKTSSAGGGGGDVNVFANRQDLREVDQSVNLMDAEAGTYESSRKSSTRKTRKKRQSMVEVFLGEQKTDNLSTFTKNGRKGRNKLYRDDGFLDRFTDCLSHTCSMTIKVLCSLPVLILVACLTAGLFLIPMLMEHMDDVNSAAKTTSTPQVTTPPEPATTSPPEPETALQDSAIPSGLFSQEEIDTRLKNLQELLTQQGFDLEQANPEALQWMAAIDPAKTDIQDESALERFAMAAFFFAMHPETLAEDGLVSEERQATRGLAAGTKSWMSGSPICEWQGVECSKEDTHRVVHLNASQTKLQGDLPEELTLLTDLIELDLSKNLIHGSLPASFPTKLSNLEYVWLQSNQIRGSIPATIGDWTSVYHMDLSSNQLTGELPTSIAHLTQIRLLFLEDNYLEGSIPMQLGHLPKIEYLYLGQNELTGELPMDLLSKVSTMVDLRLNDNALTGTIPPEIESLHRLEFLSLKNNQLGGELPDVFERMHYLVEMDLRNNMFTGSLPESLSMASSLEKLMLDHNKFVGDVNLCEMPKLSFLSADCLPDSSMTCDCCDKCY